MALSVDINRLLKGGAVEWDRIDFRKTFQPLPVLRSICGFANDIKNTGGGYIIIGVEPDDGHLPIFPVRGLSPGEITIFKQEIARICKHIYPPYYPIIEVDEYRNKQLLLLWVPVGANRPYQVPRGLIKPTQYSFYVRTSTATRKATVHEELELISLANQIPYDSQVHHLADITDLNFNLIQAYLTAAKSSLSTKLHEIPFADVCKRMNIAVAMSNGQLTPRNAGLLLFSSHPQKFFPGFFIELTEFDALGRYREKAFTGPLAFQIDTALTYIRGMVIAKMGKEYPKPSVKVEYFNYPFEAVKEALINAVYHSDYKENSPIEIKMTPKGMEIISWPGPLPPLDNQRLKSMELSVRRVRNPLLGHFLKQMRLIHGKVTGLEKIGYLMKNNGNPPPVFETDKKLKYFKVFLPVHPKFAPKPDVLEVQARPVKEINEIVLTLSQACPKLVPSMGQVGGKDTDIKSAAMILLAAQEERSLEDLMFKLSHTNKSRFRKSFIKPLMALGWLEYTLPQKPTSEKQKYLITQDGRRIIEQGHV